MRRREFFALAAASGTGLLIPKWAPLLGDSILLSANPMIAEFNLQSLDGRYTPTADFYVRNHFAVPSISEGLSLSIEGEVQQSLKLTPSSLASLKTRELGAVLECSGNGTGPEALVSNGLWEGWPLEEVLAPARPTAKAAYLHLIGRDGFSRSVPTERVGPNAMLATRLNHEPLAPEHGAPWRALFPGRYGMNSVKWVERIVLSAEPLPPDTDEYRARISTPSGGSEYQALPSMLVKSVITYPAMGVILHPGSVTVRGVAWSGSGKVAAVEVSTDNGAAWKLAKLDPGNQYEWTLWQHTVKVPEAGVLNVACKALDDKGAEQPAGRDPKRLDGYANNTIERVHFLVE
jgi:DMSO/TMAO reductase YedYZ molybdopterin-dependent catalytic subunit